MTSRFHGRREPSYGLTAIARRQHSDVIRLWRPSREILRRSQQTSHNALHRILAVLAQKALQPLLVKKIPHRIGSLGDAVGVEHNALSRLDPATSGYILNSLEHTQHRTALLPQRPSALRRKQIRRIVPRIGELYLTSARIEHAVE